MARLATCWICGRRYRVEVLPWDLVDVHLGGIPDGWECPDYPHKDRHMAKSYNGTRTPDGCIVNVVITGTANDHGYSLKPRNDVRDHSPDGFEWGYGGSGPAQLALAMCIDYLDGDVERAQLVYHGVKFGMIGPLKGDTFVIDGDHLGEVIKALEAGRAKARGASEPS